MAVHQRYSPLRWEVENRILSLMPAQRSNSRSYRFTNGSVKKLERLSGLLEKTDTQIIEEAIAHLLGTLERDQPVWMTSPPGDEKTHKRPPRDAA